MIRTVIAALLLVVVFTGSAFCQSFSQKEHSIGLDFPCFGWLQKNSSGQIEANLGINLGLGVSYKRYFEPLKVRDFNPFWGVGTVMVIFPYAGVGIEYVWPEGWYLGGGALVMSGVHMGRDLPHDRPIGVYAGPEIHGGYMF